MSERWVVLSVPCCFVEFKAFFMSNVLDMTLFTFVTAYFELNASQTDVYFHHFKQLVSLGFPILLFLDSKLEYRKHELEEQNVRIEIMDWNDFPINQFRITHNIEAPLTRPHQLSEVKDTELYMTLMNTKPYFLLKASHICTFETYVWIDFGILKLISDLEHVRSNFTKLKQYSTIVIPGGFHNKGILTDEQLMKSTCWRFLGGIVICPQLCVQSFFESTFHELTQLVLKGKITWELNIWANVESKYPGLIQYFSADCNYKMFGLYDQKIILVHRVHKPIADISTFQTWVCDVVASGGFHAVCFICDGTDDVRVSLESAIERLRNLFIVAGISDDAATFCAHIGWDTEYTYTCTLDSVGMKFTKSTDVLPRFTADVYKVTHVYANTESAVPTFQRIKSLSAVPDVGYLPKSVCTIAANAPPTTACSHFTRAMCHFTAGQWKEAIQCFKQSIRGGALQNDEIWCAHYRIAQAWRFLENDIKMEAWLNKTYLYKKTRAEPLFLACTVFRERGQNFKAYHYYKLGKSIPRPNDSEAYCVEPSVYAYKLDYENTILHYWIYSSPTDRIKGLIDILGYLNKTEYCSRNVLENMDYYVPRLGDYGIVRSLGCLETADNYAPSSASIIAWKGRQVVNIRYVNYRIQPNGGYMMYDNGTYNSANNIKTRNGLFYLDCHTGGDITPTFFDSLLTDIPKLDSGIRGIEDVRLFAFQDKLMYTATTREYSYKQDINRILVGTYDIDTMTFRNNRILRPPTETVCEKNWIPINHRDEKILFVYGWHPLQIGELDDTGRLCISIKHATPSFWKHYRGSSSFISHNNQLWCITHGVKEGSPRRYYHQFVALDKDTYTPLSYSVPFFFMEYKIEYCIGLVKVDDTFVCIFSRNDKDPYVLTLKTSAVGTLMINV